ncbi:uncharacterized protein LOC123516046 [Portunus trituberculatus]|uniref:uncharacterized protein LOC123516046 n=1 Tax=Portunus trituberculatus TaxID=210409 RepID=UPI001E1D0084|nr:uncharacterized protein LOC123516046 [Portunus trituberculatus]
MNAQEYEEVPEEVVETSFMCGECFLLFPTTEDFNAHHCQVAEVVKVEDGSTQHVEVNQPTTSTLDVPQSTEIHIAGTWEAGESEAAMEEAVASILGERMKRTALQEHPPPKVQLVHTSEMSEGEVGLSTIKETQVDPLLEHTVEDTHHMESNVQLDAVEIPTTNLYMYDNPVYLNRLMKDNTFGRRVRHDAPYSQRLGPWDNKSSRMLIQLLGEYPRAYFILDKECKRTEAWELIRIRLAEADFQFTVLQIRMRWRELCKKYRNTVNHNDMFKTRKTCQFFDEMNELFGVWDHPATLLLIRQLETNGGKPLGQNGGTRMRIKVWEHIRQVLASHGYNYTADQVQGRWSNLVTLYQRMVEHNSRPHNEPITIAFKDHIERIFNYVPERNSKWLKIMEKRGKCPKSVPKKWSAAVERKLLTYYYERVYRFNNDHIDNTTLWKEIVQKLEDEDGYYTTIEKVRTRFYELTKQFSISEQHNAQPGTIRRECKHHEMLAEIYNTYNFWPHDRSTIKMEKTNTIRMRQVNTQLMWNEDQSRTLLQLYPQVLVSHVASGDHQPIEELWLQLAKAYMNAANDRKQCYEIEEHIALMRRGYHSQNPFPFVTEMQLLEETESTFGFVPDSLPITGDQLISYWSHRAAHLLLDLVIHHRQEGVKNSGLFEAISRDLADYGYRYTGEECRVYYSLLRQVYTNRLRTIKRNKEMIKPFPYMDKMAEVDAVVSQPKFVETPENRQAILSAATSKVDELKGKEGEVQIAHWLVNLKMSLKCKEAVVPPPPVKCLARILAEIVEASSHEANLDKCCTALSDHLNHLKLIAGKGISNAESNNMYKSRGRKPTPKSVAQPKYGNVQWTEKNLITMLRIIIEWKLLCHDSVEVEVMLGNRQPLWREVASSISDHYKLDPAKCYARFSQLCREYKSVMTFNARLGKTDGAKSVVCQDLLDCIMSLDVFHDAQLDLRDRWWASDKSRSWGQDETLDLIFTVREMWTGSSKVNWDVVSEMMAASGYKHTGESCQQRFQCLFKSYQAAVEHNQHCNIRTRRRPPFYYKLRDLFGTCDMNSTFVTEATENPNQEICLDKTQVLPVLVTLLRKVRGSYCHSVPRRPFLLLLAQHLNEYFQCTTSTFNSCCVWKLMVHLHEIHYDAAEHNTIVQEDMNLGDLWQKNPKPVVAYGLHALPLPGWEKACKWKVNELYLLIEAAVDFVLQQPGLEQKGKTVETVASKLLNVHGYEKTPEQCREQWQYIVTTFLRGGYLQFKEQLNLIHILAPSLLVSLTNNAHISMSMATSHQQQQIAHRADCKTTMSSATEIKDTAMIHSSKKRKVGSHHCSRLPSKEATNDGDETSASENITSFVQINVPSNKSVRKRRTQASISERKREGRSVPYCTEKGIDISADSKNGHSVLRSVKRSSCTSKEKSSKATVNTKRASTSSTDAKLTDSKPSSEKTNSLKAPKDKVQVEVLSITENKTSKLIECRTVEGASPTQSLKLYYPADHPLPPNVRYLYIPQAMFHSNCGSPIGKDPLPNYLEDNSVKASSGINVKQEINCEGDETNEELDRLSEPNDVATFTINPEKEAVLGLLSKYNQHCKHGKERLHDVIQEYHRDHISALKKMTSLFKELQECV